MKNEIEFKIFSIIRFRITDPQRNTLLALAMILVFILALLWFI